MKKLILVLSIITLCSTFISAQNMEVKGAGTKEVNGIYLEKGKQNGHARYVKGKYVLFYKGCKAKWMIKSPEGNLYRNKTDSKTPPRDNWEKGCAKNNKGPAPIVVPVAEKSIDKNEKILNSN